MIAGASTFIRHAELVSASIAQPARPEQVEKWTPDQVGGDEHGFAVEAQELLAISLGWPAA